jgi:hypothetical protein
MEARIRVRLTGRDEIASWRGGVLVALQFCRRVEPGHPVSRDSRWKSAFSLDRMALSNRPGT